MKIVISNSGCFELDYSIVKRYFELNNMGVPYFYERISWESKKNEYKLVEIPSDCYFITSKSHLGDFCDYHLLFGDDYFDCMEIPRDDINLVKAVEESNFKNLKVVDIPDDVKWYIYEMESGSEIIHEEHRTWY